VSEERKTCISSEKPALEDSVVVRNRPGKAPAGWEPLKSLSDDEGGVYDSKHVDLGTMDHRRAEGNAKGHVASSGRDVRGIEADRAERAESFTALGGGQGARLGGERAEVRRSEAKG